TSCSSRIGELKGLRIGFPCPSEGWSELPQKVSFHITGGSASSSGDQNAEGSVGKGHPHVRNTFRRVGSPSICAIRRGLRLNSLRITYSSSMSETPGWRRSRSKERSVHFDFRSCDIPYRYWNNNS